MDRVDHSMALTPPSRLNISARAGAFIAGLGILFLYIALLSAKPLFAPVGLVFALTPLVVAGILATTNMEKWRDLVYVLTGAGALGLIFYGLDFTTPNWVLFVAVFVLPTVGGILYFANTFGLGPAGIKNNGNFHSEATKNSGVIAWMLTIVFTGFYVCLYWFPQNLYGLVAASDPICYLLTGTHTVQDGMVVNQWFAYTMLYSFLVLVMGIRFMFKYRHNKYQLIRTVSVTFFQ
ncbi:MAG: hypothetical protein AAF570_00005, partial [Bacteroidota bacterium]